MLDGRSRPLPGRATRLGLLVGLLAAPGEPPWSSCEPVVRRASSGAARYSCVAASAALHLHTQVIQSAVSLDVWYKLLVMRPSHVNAMHGDVQVGQLSKIREAPAAGVESKHAPQEVHCRLPCKAKAAHEMGCLRWQVRQVVAPQGVLHSVDAAPLGRANDIENGLQLLHAHL